jgi:hypothetical protein
MTVSAVWPCESGLYDRALPNALAQRALGGAAVVGVALVCAWTICVNIGGSRADNFSEAHGDRPAFAGDFADRFASLSNPTSSAIDIATFDSRFSAAFPSGAFLGSEPFAADRLANAPAASQPTNLPRQTRRLARSQPPPHVFEPRLRQHGKPSDPDGAAQPENLASAPADKPTLFQRLFGNPSPSPSIFAKLFGTSPSKVTLAYAAPEGGVAADAAGITSGLFDRQTAVYDISAHTVYLPDGTALEAHSGIGERLDDPHYAAERDRGPTPPDVYDLEPRGRPFHGVQALRLVPEDRSKVFGRQGLLAHTYMLGPNGQSNGCVSFKDYDTFLQAYENHEITRLAVVARVD